MKNEKVKIQIKIGFMTLISELKLLKLVNQFELQVFFDDNFTRIDNLIV